MKIAVSAKENSLDSQVDERFGRTPLFIIYDLEADSISSMDNTQVINSPQGAGIQAAQHVVEAGVDAVITGHVGPKAFRVLKAADVDIYLGQGLTVKQAIAGFKAGKLEQTDSSDVESH